MTFEEIKELGWQERGYSNFTYGKRVGSAYYLMLFNKLEEVDSVIIKYVDKDLHTNIIENSDTIFAGVMKTVAELKLVMSFLEIIEYKQFNVIPKQTMQTNENLPENNLGILAQIENYPKKEYKLLDKNTAEELDKLCVKIPKSDIEEIKKFKRKQDNIKRDLN